MSVVTELEDEDDDRIVYADIRDTQSASSQSKLNQAFKHLDFFLSEYLPQVGCDQTIYGRLLPYRGIECNPTFETADAFWDDLFGRFFEYLATSAYVGRNPKNGRIAYSSATGYASSLKAYFCNNFRKLGPELSVFSQSRWRVLRNKLLLAYKDQAQESGKALSTSHVTSSQKDRQALAVGCFWSGSSELAEFLHLNNAKFHMCGRGSEVAMQRVSALYLKDIAELHYNYRVFSAQVQRSKGGPFQELPVFPHRDSVHEDFYFSLAYNALMSTEMSSYVFPRFASRALQKTNDKKDSRVAALWTFYFKGIRKTFEDLSNQINSGLSSHSDKRGSNQLMADASCSSALAQIFRSGWEVRSVHSLFDYVLGSSKMLNESGKVVSNWTSKIGTVIIGGQPPTLLDIVSETHLVNPFVSACFGIDSESEWSDDIRKVLIASVLRHYQEFCSIILQHPDGAYTELERHPFVSVIKSARMVVGVEQCTFDSWCKEVRAGFISRNLPALPIDLLRKEGADVSSLCFDARTFTDHFNAVAHAYYVLHTDNSRMEDLIGRLNTKVDKLTNQTRSFELLFNRQAEVLERLAARLDVVMPPSTVVVAESSSFFHGVNIHDVPYFSVVSKRWPSMSAKAVFVSWFNDHLAAAFERDKGSNDWKIRPDPEKARIKSLFARVKKVVRCFLTVCNSFPPPKPKDEVEFTTWYSNLIQMAAEAETVLKFELFQDPNVLLTVGSLINHRNAKHWNKLSSALYRELPYDTPDDLRLYFNKATTRSSY